MNWLSENQDETFLHEGKGGTWWFREETTCKKVIHIARTLVKEAQTP